ncbi:hypothetical protein KO481_41055 [Nocardia sp. NEAU-G5]|uniref:Uncharacterized protein n=1 Tax=Nocardia albiluteola TaxID=2842303 RepID=A0ABS6BDN8_9NOCA|nr:hypothetical protein [Nocardia albiluteola]MBU3067891.1 hypothetical protein [Nocardia albiluteola]
MLVDGDRCPVPIRAEHLPVSRSSFDYCAVSSERPQDGFNLRASDLDRSMACTALDNFASSPNRAAGLLNWWKQHNRLR